MKIRQIEKIKDNGFLRVSISEYNNQGLLIYKSYSGNESRYYYDEKGSLIRIEYQKYTDDPTEYEIKFEDLFTYNGENCRVITYKTHIRPINGEWYPQDEVMSIREIKYSLGNVILNRINYVNPFSSMEYVKFQYHRDELIYEEKFNQDGTYSIKRFKNGNISSFEKKTIFYGKENLFHILKTDYSYCDNLLFEESTYFDNQRQDLLVRYAYADGVLIKKNYINTSAENEITKEYINYTYDTNQLLTNIETYILYNNTFHLCQYDEIIYEDLSKTTRHFSNHEYAYLKSCTNIDFSTLNQGGVCRELLDQGIVVTAEEIPGYQKRVSDLLKIGILIILPK